MNVTFANNMRRSSDGSFVPPLPGQMIVAFGERRRGQRRPPTSDKAGGSSKNKPSLPPQSSSSSRRLKGRGASGTTRKQTLPAPTPTMMMDPPGRKGNAPSSPQESRDCTRRKNLKESKRPSSKKTVNTEKMVVEFPSSKRNPTQTRSRRVCKEPTGFSGIFRKNCNVPQTSREPDVSSSYTKKEEQQTRTSSNTRRKQQQQGFQDAVDWRNTSIDWGDEDADNRTISGGDDDDDESTSCGINHKMHKKGFCPAKVHRRDGRCRRRTSSSKDDQHHDSQTTSATDCLTDSNISIGSSLTLSLTSLFSIQKLDPQNRELYSCME